MHYTCTHVLTNISMRWRTCLRSSVCPHGSRFPRVAMTASIFADACRGLTSTGYLDSEPVKRIDWERCD